MKITLGKLVYCITLLKFLFAEKEKSWFSINNIATNLLKSEGFFPHFLYVIQYLKSLTFIYMYILHFIP